MLTPAWPDTTHTDPPTGYLYASACWLLGRHRQLAELAARVPGVVDVDEDGPWLDLDALTQAVNDLDAARAAWRDYADRKPAPRDEDAYQAWEDAGSPTPPAAHAIGVMSRTEQVRLRLLATLGPSGVRFTVDDLWGFDPAGHALIADWCRAVQAL